MFLLRDSKMWHFKFMQIQVLQPRKVSECGPKYWETQNRGSKIQKIYLVSGKNTQRLQEAKTEENKKNTGNIHRKRNRNRKVLYWTGAVHTKTQQGEHRETPADTHLNEQTLQANKNQ